MAKNLGIDDAKMFEDLKKEGLSSKKARALVRKILKDQFRG